MDPAQQPPPPGPPGSTAIAVAPRLRHIFISPGHNYAGHHGRPPDAHPVQDVDHVECLAGQGLLGDRYFGHREGYKGQITFFAWEVYLDLAARLGIQDKSPAVFRRNVITDGLDLNTLIGREFELQGILFCGTEECKPCYWMNQAFGPGAEVALRGHDGLRARILTDGILRRTP
jgi:MOSC domain-containing protein YiiM